MFFRLILFFLLAASAPVTVYSDTTLRYQPSGLYTKFNYSEEHSYADYRRDVMERLSLNWRQLLGAEGEVLAAEVEKIVDMLSPTDKPPRNCTEAGSDAGERKYRRGILLIHGLYDSPYVMKDIERLFNENCFYTRSILLPGHGTRPGDMLEINHRDWIKAVDFAVDRFKADVDDLYIAGFSTGGTLAIRKAIKEPASIKGLFLFAPALKVKSTGASFLHGLGKKWVPWQLFGDDDIVKYESIALKSVIEVSLLADEVRNALESQNDGLDVPAMIVISEGDYTVPAEETIRIFDKGLFGEKSRTIVYRRGERPDSIPINCYNPDVSSDEECSKIYYNSRLEYKSGNESFIVSDFSHMSLTLSPEDEHYGIRGKYRYCLQYFLGAQKDLRLACKSKGPEAVCLGERSAFGSHKYSECGEGRVVRRLTSNPLFNDMAGQLGKFVRDYMDSSVILNTNILRGNAK